MRYVLCGKRLQPVDHGLFTASAVVYISRKGCTTYDGASVAVWRSLPKAKEEIEYWRTNQPRYRWRIEQLPAGPVATAILRAREVDSEI